MKDFSPKVFLKRQRGFPFKQNDSALRLGRSAWQLGSAAQMWQAVPKKHREDHRIHAAADHARRAGEIRVSRRVPVEKCTHRPMDAIYMVMIG